MRGTGYNIRFERDEFHYLLNRMMGDFVLTANIRFKGEGAVIHRKTGWIPGNLLDKICSCLFVCVHDPDTTKETTAWNVRINKPVSFEAPKCMPDEKYCKLRN